MSSALKGRRERPGSPVLMWNGSDLELHRGTVIIEDFYLEHNLSFLPSPHLLPFALCSPEDGYRNNGSMGYLGLGGEGSYSSASCRESREHTQLLKFPVPPSLPFSINRDNHTYSEDNYASQ